MHNNGVHLLRGCVFSSGKQRTQNISSFQQFLARTQWRPGEVRDDVTKAEFICRAIRIACSDCPPSSLQKTSLTRSKSVAEDQAILEHKLRKSLLRGSLQPVENKPEKYDRFHGNLGAEKSSPEDFRSWSRLSVVELRRQLPGRKGITRSGCHLHLIADAGRMCRCELENHFNCNFCERRRAALR